MNHATIGYVCGALRVSTHDSAPSLGPRAHVTGFLGGLAELGLPPRTWLAGDEYARNGLINQNSGPELSASGRLRRTGADVGRLVFRYHAQRRALAKLGLVDVLYERQATFQDVGRPFKRRGIPWVIESNGPFWYEASAERRSLEFVGTAKKVEIAAYRDADLVVAVSEPLKSIICSEADVPEERVFVLPNGTDPTRFDPDEVTPQRHFHEDMTIGFSGYLANWAGLDLLLEAVREVEKTDNLRFNIVVLGDGPDREDIESHARSLSLSERCKFLGRLPWNEVPKNLAGFDFAYSGQRRMSVGSMYHSPQKLYEYRAMGLPVIASRHQDAEALIHPDVDGFIFDSGSVTSLATALRKASKFDCSGYVRSQIRTSLIEKHSWKRRVQDLLNELRRRELLGSDVDGEKY